MFAKKSVATPLLFSATCLPAFAPEWVSKGQSFEPVVLISWQILVFVLHVGKESVFVCSLSAVLSFLAIADAMLLTSRLLLEWEFLPVGDSASRHQICDLHLLLLTQFAVRLNLHALVVLVSVVGSRPRAFVPGPEFHHMFKRIGVQRSAFPLPSCQFPWSLVVGR